MRFSERTNWNTEESELARAHRLRAASGSASRVTVVAVEPPDVIGLFTVMPGEA